MTKLSRELGTTADVVVVGAGLFGASAAYSLSQLGVGRVLLVERDMPGSGDSGRTFGMVRHHYSNDETTLLALRSIDTMRDWHDRIGVADAGYLPCGYLATVGAASVPACRENVERSRRLGGDERFLEPSELADIEPLLSLEGIAGAAYEPAGGIADVHRQILGWLTAAGAAGVECVFGTTVTGLDVEGGRVTRVRTSSGDIAAGQVLVCAGAWGRELVATAGVSLPVSLRRVPVAVMEVPPGVALPSVVCAEAVSNLVVRPDRARSFWGVAYGGQAELAMVPLQPEPVPAGYDAIVAAAVAERYPSLSGARYVAGWSGVYDYTPDWNPVVGFAPGLENLYVAFGSSGHGFKLAPALGECIAAALSGAKPPVDIARLAPDRFETGQLLHMGYGPNARA
ncbi:MAG TPA: FAD-binding oxidoreductase [Acidimicrobiales bacterium]|nr:FAD-binding oxidoreductase [Acidimicrobiales bacterium]